MPLRAWFLIIAAAFAAALLGHFSQRWLHPPVDADALQVGDQRLDFELPDTTGNLRRLSEFDGKIIVLNFWATWCGPCIEEIPLLGEFQRDYANRGVQVVAVALDDADAVKRFSRRTPLQFPSLLGEMATLNIGRLYGNHRAVLPYTVVIDRHGNIASFHVGQLNRSRLERAVVKLL
jgi:peroxiredoxin